MIEVRPATPDDADAIAAAHVASWRAGYRGIVPDTHLDAPAFVDERLTFWRNGAWRERAPGSELWVATIDGQVVGMAQFGPERTPEGQEATGWGEVYVFYLHPDAWGSGAATTLMRAAEQQLGARGYRDALLWVLRDNARGRAFYAKAGWTATDREDHFEVGGTQLTDVRYQRTLTG